MVGHMTQSLFKKVCSLRVGGKGEFRIMLRGK